MANDVLIDGGSHRAKVRSPGLVLLFSLLTVGVYTWFWWYFINRELASFGAERETKRLGDRPWLSVLGFTLGAIVTVPMIWTAVTTNRRIQAAQRMTGGSRLNGWVCAVLWILTFSFGAIAYMQAELNKVWRSPGMRPADPTDTTLADAERVQKLRGLVAAGALTEPEYEAERQRLRLP